MPGFVTHHIFGINAFHGLPKGNAKDIIRKHNKAYALGLQGPDLFFYFLPTSSGLFPNIANRMHKENTGEFFNQLIIACSTVKDLDDYETCNAYIQGFIGHYLLDSAIHPYVYCRVTTKPNKEVLGVHFGLETDIDREVLMHYKGKKLTELDHRKAIDITPKEQDAIARLLHKAILATYDVDISIRMIKAAVISFKIESSIIMDKKANKHKVISKIEDMTFHHPFLSPLLINDVTHSKDSCNEAHEEWYNPWDDTITSTQSIFDIMDEKIPKYVNAIELMDCALLNSYNRTLDNSPAVLKELGNLSYTSGLDCTIPLKR